MTSINKLGTSYTDNEFEENRLFVHEHREFSALFEGCVPRPFYEYSDCSHIICEWSQFQLIT